MMQTFVIKLLVFSLMAHVVVLEQPQTIKSNAPGKPGTIRLTTNHERRRRNIGDNTEFTLDEIQGIIDRHNYFRRNVSPGPASDMLYMEWYEDLEESAQQWADTCNWAHGGIPSGAGQNLYATTASPDSGLGITATNAWNDEDQYYDYDTNSCATGEVCGHYTQNVWASTEGIGCGIRFCSSITGLSWQNGGNIVVCNYGPGGNIVGQRPYELGPKCSECLANTDNGVCDDGLCRLCNSDDEDCLALGCDLDCQHGGECYLDEEDGAEEKCNCPYGFTGQLCQRMTAYCECEPAR
ncbi:peptidase inhibitor 16-like [Antedon mediterranea]|uniref:peptidase inhibitor 16-like n=1 Tax=Antedon mediterranea TaxID=105859 RepID=UPI003AF7C65E